MRCFNPITIKDSKGIRTVPCGKCAYCLDRNRQQWAFRLEYELKKTLLHATFLTLTYDDDNLPYDENGYPCFDKRQVQLYLKRIRHLQNTSLKYYLISEYGGNTYRPHYHAIMYNIESPEVLNNIMKEWKFGFVYSGTVTPNSINYVCKFHINSKINDHTGILMKPFSLISKKIGASYLQKENMRFHNERRSLAYNFCVVNSSGIRTSMPRYYKDKIYNKHQKEILKRELPKVYNQPNEYESFRNTHPNGTLQEYINFCEDIKLNKIHKVTLKKTKL